MLYAPMLQVTCFNSQGEFTPPDEIVFIPEGKNKITPFVNGEPKEVTINLPAERGEEIAASFQRDMEKRLTQNVRPSLDFDHKPGPASALPKSFRYQPGQGLMAKVEWTGAGKAALQAKNYSYFSPQFLLSEDGTPLGLEERGPLGGLVNEPAFRNIPKIAARDGSKPTQTNTMSDLVQCGLLTSTEAAKDNASELARNRVTALRSDAETVKAKDAEITTLKEKVNDLEAKVKASDETAQKAKEDTAKNLVLAAVADGRIAPKDEATQTFWEKSLVTAADGDESAKKALEALPKNPSIAGKTVVKSGNGEKVGDGAGDMLSEAQSLIQAGQAKTEEEAFVIIARDKPELYESYNKQFATAE